MSIKSLRDLIKTKKLPNTKKVMIKGKECIVPVKPSGKALHSIEKMIDKQ